MIKSITAIGFIMAAEMAGGGVGEGAAVRRTSIGRKRVVLSSADVIDFGYDDGEDPTTAKKQCVPGDGDGGSKSALESLPQEILIRIVCGEEHDDLKRLFFVSRAVREATVAAKRTHFAYSTPRRTVGFRNADECSGSPGPNAPKQLRPRLSPKKLAEISVALFRDLALEIETRK